MSKVQRHEEILLDELNIKKILSLENAMGLLCVSESTARRLFAMMEQKGICVRSNGCIKLLNNDLTNMYVYERMEDTNTSEKTVIAQKALKLIKSGEVLFLDGGTTVAKLSAEIAKKAKEKKLSGIHVYTNSLVNFNLLKDYVKVELVGGEYRENRKDFVGANTEKVIRGMYFNSCFVGADGYIREKGFIAKDSSSASIAGIVIASSDKSYVLADADKFAKNAGMCFAEDKMVTAVITNDTKKLCDLSENEIMII